MKRTSSQIASQIVAELKAAGLSKKDMLKVLQMAREKYNALKQKETVNG